MQTRLWIFMHQFGFIDVCDDNQTLLLIWRSIKNLKTFIIQQHLLQKALYHCFWRVISCLKNLASRSKANLLSVLHSAKSRRKLQVNTGSSVCLVVLYPSNSPLIKDHGEDHPHRRSFYHFLPCHSLPLN